MSLRLSRTDAKKTTRHDGAVDSAPGSHVHGCHVVGWTSESTPNALEVISRSSILLVNALARGTGARGVSRGNENERDNMIQYLKGIWAQFLPSLNDGFLAPTTCDRSQRGMLFGGEVLGNAEVQVH